jgi:hypothetical protein
MWVGPQRRGPAADVWRIGWIISCRISRCSAAPANRTSCAFAGPVAPPAGRSAFWAESALLNDRTEILLCWDLRPSLRTESRVARFGPTTTTHSWAESTAMLRRIRQRSPHAIRRISRPPQGPCRHHREGGMRRGAVDHLLSRLPPRPEGLGRWSTARRPGRYPSPAPARAARRRRPRTRSEVGRPPIARRIR